MGDFVPFYNLPLAVGALLLQIGILFFVVSYFVQPLRNALFPFLARRAAPIILFLAGGSVVGSFIYSNLIGYPPCSLCWWERIFMYPIAIIALVALIKKRDDAAAYILPLASLGGFVALYHSYIQYGGEPFIPCAADGISCAQRFVFEFGYMTIPLMALTGFVAILLLLFATSTTQKA